MNFRNSVIFVALLVIAPMVSWGHAFPDHSDPKVGALVQGSPSRVRIWFDSDLEPAFSTLMVHDATGKMVDKRDAHVDRNDSKLLEVDVPVLPAGTYIVVWNAVARDGHRTNGQYTFTVK